MRKKGLVEKIVMSEPASEDFSSCKFPQNRYKLFWYMLKNKFAKIYLNHWLITLFFLPLIAWGVMTLSYSDWLFRLEGAEGITHFIEHWFTVYVTAIPLWALGFVGLAGGLNVIRKLAWSDPVILKSDFLQGIKVSGRQLSFVGFLWGVAFALFGYAFNWLGFYYKVFDDSISVVFGIFLCLLLLIFTIGLTVYMTCMASMYNVNTTQLLLGSFKLYFADFFIATGVIIISILPFFLLMLSGLALLHLVVYLLVTSLLLGIIIIPMFLVCQHSFDRVINKKDYPDYYGRGLSYGQNIRTVDADDDDDFTLEPELDINEKIYIENDFERVNNVEN